MLQQWLLFLEELAADVAAHDLTLAPGAPIAHHLSDVKARVVDNLLSVEKELVQLFLYLVTVVTLLYFHLHVDDPLLA